MVPRFLADFGIPLGQVTQQLWNVGRTAVGVAQRRPLNIVEPLQHDPLSPAGLTSAQLRKREAQTAAELKSRPACFDRRISAAADIRSHWTGSSCKAAGTPHLRGIDRSRRAPLTPPAMPVLPSAPPRPAR